MTLSDARGDSGDDRDDARNRSPVLTVQEVAKLLRVGRNTVYSLAARGQIPHRRLGKRLLFHEGAIHLWLAGDYASRFSSAGVKALERRRQGRSTSDADPDEVPDADWIDGGGDD